jgi:hypothetical protein
MKMNYKQRVAVFMVAVLLVLLGAVAANAQTVQQKFEWVIAKRLTVNTQAAIGTDLTVGDDVAVTGDTDITGALGVTGGTTLSALQVNGNGVVTGTFSTTGNLAAQSKVYFIPPATLTVTDGATIAVTGAIMELTATGAVGADLAAPTDGQIVFLVNVGAQTIVITETATAVMAGNATLGAGDTLSLAASGVKWYEVARSNN